MAHAIVKGLLLSGLAAIGVTSCDTDPHMMMGGKTSPTQYQSSGERIYFTATSDSGDPITYSGGNMHMSMMRDNGCATCHGLDRRGGVRMMPQFWKVTPPITREALFGDHAEGASDGHGEHESYTDDALRRAIYHGLDPSGEPLDEVMPRWNMSERDWQDLLAYLRNE